MSIYYNTGTISVNHNSPYVSGAGTSWSSNVSGGDIFCIYAENALYVVDTVISNTRLSLTTNYLNAESGNISASKYSLIHDYNIGQYKLGEVSILSGSTYVSGSYDSWNEVSGGIPVSGMFMVQGEVDHFNISSIEEGHIELAQPYCNQRGTDIYRQGYLIVRDYTENYEWPLIVAGDKGWTILLSRSLNLIDQELHAPSLAHINFEQIPSGSIVSVSGGSYYAPDESVKLYPPNATVYFDTHFNALLYSDGTMASAAPLSGAAPVWYPQWYRLDVV